MLLEIQEGGTRPGNTGTETVPGLKRSFFVFFLFTYHIKSHRHLAFILFVALKVVSAVWLLVAEINHSIHFVQQVTFFFAI
jgi:hypothetical protein